MPKKRRRKTKQGLIGEEEKTLGPQEHEALQEVLDRLKIDKWDFLLVGDGSGSNWDHEAGFGCVSIECNTMERLVWWGAFNRGTVNLAELMAYVQPLSYLVSREEEKRKRRRARRMAYNVHILTDSDYCQETGNSSARLHVTKNAGIWSALDVFVRQGFILHWHHIPRESVALNCYVDILSKCARRANKGYNLQSKVEEALDKSVYEINPEEG